MEGLLLQCSSVSKPYQPPWCLGNPTVHLIMAYSKSRLGLPATLAPSSSSFGPP